MSEARGAQGCVAHGPTPLFSHRLRKNLPKGWQVFGFGDEFSARDSARRALHNSARNCILQDNSPNGVVLGGAIVASGLAGNGLNVDTGEFTQLLQIDASESRHDRSGLRTFQSQGAVARRLISKRHVIHDDVFVEPFDQALANHGVGHAEEPVGKRVRLDLGENVALWIEQQGNGAVADVSDAVGPGECEVGAVILVDQRDSVSRIAVLGGLVAKVIGHGASEPNANLRARSSVQRRERGSQNCGRRSHFKCPSSPPFSLPKACAALISAETAGRDAARGAPQIPSAQMIYS